MRNTRPALLAALLTLSACGEAAVYPAGAGNTAQGTDEAAAEQAALSSDGPDASGMTDTAAAAQAADAPLSESDRMQLQGAEAACRNTDFNAFLFVFAQSAAVQARYTAAQVSFGPEGRSQRIARATYLSQHGVGIGALDHSFYTGDSVRAWERAMANGQRIPLENIVRVLNSSNDNRHRVEWSRATFDGNAEEGPGRPTALVGDPGALLFQPTDAGCWELVADYRPSLPGSITLADVQR